MLEYHRRMPGLEWLNSMLAGLSLATAHGLTPLLLKTIYLSEEKANRMFFLYSYPFGTVLGILAAILAYYTDARMHVDKMSSDDSYIFFSVYSALFVSLAVGTLSCLRMQTVKRINFGLKIK